MLRCRSVLCSLSAVSFFVSLISCGGGGGSGSNGGGTHPPETTQPIALTQANATGVAAESLHQIEAAASTTELFLQILGGLSFPTGITSSNCSLGGSEDVEFRDNDNNQILSSGDVLILRDRHCSAGGILSQGDVTISYTFVGSGQAGTLTRHTGTITFNKVESSYSQSGQNIFKLDGALSFDYERPAAFAGSHALSISSSGASLAISFGAWQGSLQITNVSLVERQAANDFEINVDAIYTMPARSQSVGISTGSSSGLGGVYGQYPTTGLIRLIGAHGSEIRLIPNSIVSTPYLAFSLDEQGLGIFTTLVLTPSPAWENYSAGFFIRAAN